MLSVELLRESHPNVLTRWVLVGVVASIVGYFASALNILIEHSADELFRRPDLWALCSSLFALGLHLRGWGRAAAVCVLGPVWLDQHVTLATMPQALWASPGAVLPLLVLLTGVWLGARPAAWMGGLTVLSVPMVVGVSGLLGIGQGLSGKEVMPQLISILLAIGVTLILLTLFLGTLGQLLRQSEADRRRAKDLLDDTPDAILALDAEDCIQEANPAAAGQFCVGLDELVGASIKDLAMAPAEQSWPDALLQLHEGARPVEFTIPGRRIVEAVARRRERPDGSQGSLVVLRDITARRETEHQNQILWLKLQQAQKMEAVGMLAGSVAHDFNNLLTAVGGYGALLQDSTDEEARSYATELMSMQERGATLVRQLLSHARRDVVQARPLDLAKLLGSLEPLMQRVVSVQVHLSIHVEQGCVVVADAGQIEQVLLNLVANARDAMPKGGTLEVNCLRAGDQVLLEVQDTGQGIAEKDRERVFEPFFTTKERGKGTGLGLATAATLVREAGGSIEVSSTSPAGTTFVIALPATDQSDLEVSYLSAPASKQLRGDDRHIMVVEDNDSLRSYLKLVLDRAGFRVTLISSGDEAVTRIKTLARPPDLLVTDVVLPGRTGPQLAADARVRFPDLPVLFMTGYAGAAGAHSDFVLDDALAKPFTERELLERIAAKFVLKRGSVAS